MREPHLYATEASVYTAWYLLEQPQQIFNASKIRKNHFGLFPGLLHDLMEGYRMKGNKKANEYANTVQWCNIPLSDESIDAIDSWGCDDTTLLSLIVEVVTAGHSISCKLAPDGQSFMAFAIGLTEQCANRGCGLSAFADEPRNAYKVLMYKHFSICGGTWGRSAGAKTSNYR